MANCVHQVQSSFWEPGTIPIYVGLFVHNLDVKIHIDFSSPVHPCSSIISGNGPPPDGIL